MGKEKKTLSSLAYESRLRQHLNPPQDHRSGWISPLESYTEGTRFLSFVPPWKKSVHVIVSLDFLLKCALHITGSPKLFCLRRHGLNYKMMGGGGWGGGGIGDSLTKGEYLFTRGTWSCDRWAAICLSQLSQVSECSSKKWCFSSPGPTRGISLLLYSCLKDKNNCPNIALSRNRNKMNFSLLRFCTDGEESTSSVVRTFNALYYTVFWMITFSAELIKSRTLYIAQED